jgi:hypothetical protein
MGFCFHALSNSADEAAKTPEGKRQDATIIATVMCQESIRRQIHTPTTASFDLPSVNGGPPNWVVTGTVHYRNDFNAEITTTYSCRANTDDSTAVAVINE